MEEWSVHPAETERPKVMDRAITASMQGMILKIKVKKRRQVFKRQCGDDP
ncbi:hypothetical protein [Candidatus Methanoperedens sp. BLZ2]|nr:hypothetical protein [Candidatus Methanoperedens sp. BLZ2]MBZ0176483.1 hypothetical protein [Candidatus Methanoperedens nitroreducens]